MASVTKKLSFALTASTTYESPYALARRFSSLDHLTKGRVGWNIVTSYLDSAARGFGLTEQIDHETRYAMAEEYLEVFYKLVEGSWADDAVQADPTSSTYIDSSKVRYIDHVGKHFRCGGPNTLPPSPQRTPYIFQAGASKTGQSFATQHSEAMFLPGLTPEQVAKTVQQVRELAVSQGRAADSIKCISGVAIIVAETDEEAQAKYQRYLDATDLDGVAALFGGWTSADLAKFSDDQDFAFSGPGAIQSMVSAWSKTIPNSGGITWTKRRLLQEIAVGGFNAKIIGSAKTVADELERWVEVGGVDGFNLSYAVSPGSFEDLVKFLWPELKKRGVLWDDYEGETTRENYSSDGKGPRVREDHPAAKYTWKAGEKEPPRIVLENKEVKKEEKVEV